MDSQSELRLYISINVNNELSGFMNTLSESEPQRNFSILREGSELKKDIKIVSPSEFL